MLPRLRLPPRVSVFGAVPENSHKFKIQTEQRIEPARSVTHCGHFQSCLV